MTLCPQCQKPLAPDIAAGLCPACLLQRGLEANTLPPDSLDPSKIDSQKSKIWSPPAIADLAPFFSDLDLLEFLGRGGMGAVYKARQKSLDRIVALKILPPSISRDPAFAARFTHEAQAMARLNHPHIVTVHEFGERTAPLQHENAGAASLAGNEPPAPASKIFYFLMEFVDGMTLGQLLAAATLTPKDALAIVPQICDGLQYAHDRGIIHRDIKPENILLTRAGQIKIADFGLAKLIGTASPAAPAADSMLHSSIAGTPAYMAPEQSAAPQSVDHRADIYALGLVFYQLLTGELPKGSGPFMPPSRKVQIDVRLDEIVLRALEQSPARRYQQASEVGTEVETILSAPLPVQTAALRPTPAATPAPPVPPPQDLLTRARNELRLPAIGLLIVSAANLLLCLLLSAMALFGFVPHFSTPGLHRNYGVDIFVPVIFGIPLNLFILISAFRMGQLRSHTRALAACVLTLFALPGNCLGLPLAIWALIILNRPHIKRAFDETSRLPASRLMPLVVLQNGKPALHAPGICLHALLVALPVFLIHALIWWIFSILKLHIPLAAMIPFGVVMTAMILAANIRREFKLAAASSTSRRHISPEAPPA